MNHVFTSIRRLPVLAFCLFIALAASAADHATVHFPDILGYRTLTCDFHSHTVFSDGDVWPTFRVREAWLEGLDVLAITDHLESQAKQAYVKGDRNTSYKLAAEAAAEYGVLLIHGGEITRSMPPGHLNALFIEDCNALAPPKWFDAVLEVKKQGGLIMWNHPGWENQRPDRIARWYPQHDSLMQTGILTGMEIVNGSEYYPEVHQWCLDKKLTIFGNSDSHSSIHEEIMVGPMPHRPATLVFAAEKTIPAVRAAILERRTCVYANNTLFGEERFLRALFDSAVVIENRKVETTGKQKFYLTLVNKTGFAFHLQLAALHPEIQFDYDIELEPHAEYRLMVRARTSSLNFAGKIRVQYLVTNMLTAPNQGLVIPLDLDVEIKASK